MPVGELAQNFSRELGAPTKELYSMAGLVFLADFFGWTAQEAAEAYIFRSDVQYALNLEPGVTVCSRTVERYQKLFRDNDLAAQIFHDVTTRLAEMLELDISCQRLDSTHVFSHMASFGRTKLMAVAIKRFLTQVKRHAPELYAALPEEFRRRYEPAESQLFAGAKDAEARQRSRQQAAEDLLWIIEHFAKCADMTGRSSYKALVTIFNQQCELSEGKVVVKAKTGGDCMQNPSDLDASYDAHKGQGYQVQLAETCSPANEVQLITGAMPQTCRGARRRGGGADARSTRRVGVVARRDAGRHALRQRRERAGGRGPRRGVGGADPRPGAGKRPGGADARRLRRGRTDRAGGGLSARTHAAGGRAGRGSGQRRESRCRRRPVRGCPFRNACPIHKTRDGRFTLDFTDKDHRLAGRRREQETPVFKERYARRSGIESTNSGLKNRLGLERLRVRGRGSVFRVILHKVAGWNVLRAAASKKLRAWVSGQVAQTLKGGESGPIAESARSIVRSLAGSQMVFQRCTAVLMVLQPREPLEQKQRLFTRDFCRKRH